VPARQTEQEHNLELQREADVPEEKEQRSFGNRVLIGTTWLSH
jgi:hypothetical protein